MRAAGGAVPRGGGPTARCVPRPSATPPPPPRGRRGRVPGGGGGRGGRALAEAGWRMDGEHATGAEELSAALHRRGWNAVLYGGDGPGAVPARKALALVRLAAPHLPFLAVSPFVRAGDLATVVRGLDADVAVVPDPARLPD